MTATRTAAEVRARAIALIAICAPLVAGCAVPDLPSYYGQHQIPAMPASVNGTDVLAEMFKQAGHTVYFRRTLVTSELDSAQTIVWFPNDFAAPTEEVCQWFDNWLYENPNRTLVFVGRDYDAAPVYWQEMTPRVDAAQRKQYEERERAHNTFSRGTAGLKDEKLTCDWFTYESAPPREIKALQGPWAKDIDASKTGIELRTKVTPDRRVKRLLASGGERLAASYSLDEWGQSRILLVANGSFLLNLPLVSHENRRLAARLIEAAGPAGNVVFLESGPGGPPIDPAANGNSLWTLFGAWPLNVVLLQLAVAGVIFCFARWPIFGRPKQPPVESTTDFGKHVEAVGQLLARTNDRQFALSRVARAEETAGRQLSGASSPTRKATDRR